MSISKLTMFMQVATGDASNPAAIRVGGWSETFYDDFAIDSEVKRQFRLLCAARAALLPATGVIVAQRYQTIDPAGPSAVELQRFPGVATYPCDYPSLSLYCRVPGVGVVNTRPMYLRGIPDQFIVKGEYVPDGPFGNSLAAYFRQCGDWNFKARDKTKPQVPIYHIDADGTVSLEASLTGVAVGSMVRLLRVTPYDSRFKVNKVWKVDTVVNDKTFKLKNWLAGECGQGGSIRLSDYVYPSIPTRGVGISTGRIVSKKIGRPFEQFRGRQSTHR